MYTFAFVLFNIWRHGGFAETGLQCEAYMPMVQVVARYAVNPVWFIVPVFCSFVIWAQFVLLNLVLYNEKI